ncbi:CLUMA_CG006587, isoform A [Clunio marinus]|uniref:CLUMA_CG006587, isoform A n=1 Tax=Clunio marinus TaxID=568069 RepID=A0A1J1HY50_9DIPT|nr:CLUMA_CG006587, isoform A [Clunio marinus]
MKIAVVGSGVVGLTTAIELQKEYRNANITIIADNFYKDTTSYVAAGIFRPGTSFSGPTEEITKKWVRDSYQHWDDIRKSSYSNLAGVCEVSGYILSSYSQSITRNFLIEDVLPAYRNATEEELKICPGNWKYGSFFTTLVTECGLYLPWATKNFLDRGGQIFNRKINDFADLHGTYDIIVNCTGLEAKNLCNDRKVVPIRGQVLKVHAPWIKMAYYGDYDTYIVPGFSGVTLGGCRNFESVDMTPNKYDFDSIKSRCEALVPSLQTAKVTEVKVGLRPHRDPVRVEYEFKDTSQGILKIIHNYGHGGYGVTTSPGTAKYAVKLVRDVWTGYSRL